jgi:tRNA A-37 threonylcarbamoyl transferase component Bud32
MRNITLHPGRSKPPTDAQLDVLATRKQQLAPRDPYVCPFCEEKPQRIAKLGDNGNPTDMANFLVGHIAEHVKYLSFLLLPGLEDEAAEDNAWSADLQNSSRKRLRNSGSLSQPPSGKESWENISLNFDDNVETSISQVRDANKKIEDIIEQLEYDLGHIKEASIPATEPDFSWDFIPRLNVPLGAVDAAFEQWVDHATLPRRHWYVPFERNEAFVDRQFVLSPLLDMMNHSASPGDCQKTAISGPYGVGRTEIALEAVFRIRENHPDCSVFWISAADAGGFEHGYHVIGTLLQLEGMDKGDADVKTLVMAALSRESTGRWLLVLDNADDMNLLFGPTTAGDSAIGTHLVSYLPRSRRGSILFTTRYYRLAEMLAGENVLIFNPGHVGEANNDGWATRPSVGSLMDNLEAFFPDLNPGQPVLNEGQVRVGTPVSSVIDGDGVKGDSSSSVAATTLDDASSYPVDIDSDSDEDLWAIPPRRLSNSRPDTLRSDRPSSTALKEATSVQKATGPAEPVHRKSITMSEMLETHLIQNSSMIVPQSPEDTISKRPTAFRWFKGQLIGKAGRGRVYLGMNATTGEFIAAKELEVHPGAAGSDKAKFHELVAALENEVEVMWRVDHVNIVQYLGCERRATGLTIFFEYIPGGSIHSYLDKHGKMAENLVANLTRQTLSGLTYLHREGIMHRDLKASHLLLDLDGTCKISGFSMSKKTESIYENDETNSMKGSVYWMAPEMIRSQVENSSVKGYSAKVDIWSLGCVVLEMLSGLRPWPKEEAVGAIYKIANGESPPIPAEVQNQRSALAIAFMLDCFQV